MPNIKLHESGITEFNEVLPLYRQMELRDKIKDFHNGRLKNIMKANGAKEYMDNNVKDDIVGAFLEKAKRTDE